MKIFYSPLYTPLFIPLNGTICSRLKELVNNLTLYSLKYFHMYEQKFSNDFYSSKYKKCSTCLDRISTHDARFEDCKHPDGDTKKSEVKDQ